MPSNKTFGMSGHGANSAGADALGGDSTAWGKPTLCHPERSEGSGFLPVAIAIPAGLTPA